MSDERKWVSVEIAADELSCSADKVQSLLNNGRLQGRKDSFGGTHISMCSIRAAAGQLNLRGVR